MPLSVTPRTPLTITELETLASMLYSATRHIGDARDACGRYVWDQGRELSELFAEIFGGFYQIRENTALMVCGQGHPWDTAESKILVSANH